MSPNSRRALALVFVFVASVAGMAWRRAPLGLPWFLYKYGGSAFWAIALYWLLVFLLPRAGTRKLVPLAAALALVIEFSRLVHVWPALDAFRMTRLGRLLLGRYFAVNNIVAYWCAISAAGFCDDLWLRPAPEVPEEMDAARQEI